MVQWAIELSQFDVEYKPRIAIKAQALANFIVEFTMTDPNQKAEYWTMYANEAEYEAILTSLRVAKALGARNLKLNVDSKLVIR